MNPIAESIKGREIRYFCVVSMVTLFVTAFLFDSPKGIMQGMWKIIVSRDILITDYFALAGYGAAFFNAGCMMLIAIACIWAVKLPFTGLTVAAVFCSAGFGLWGKNPVNMLPIVIGTYLYAKLHKANFARYVYTAVFGGCLAPFVTEFAYVLPFEPWINSIIAALLGIGLGFVIPPLAMHTASMHMGYSLYNVGFAGGVLAFVVYSVMKSFGIQCQTVFIWQEGVHPGISLGFLIYFLGTFVAGWLIENGDFSGIVKITRHSGRAVADFIMMDGKGNTLMNMGIMGVIAQLYILCIGGDLSGPILGCILTLFGFSAFGAHVRNYLPVLIGVVLGAAIMTPSITDETMQIAAILVVGVAPIAGEFGVVAGIISGMLHVAIVMCTSQMYAGLHLYNNGFSTGWVAIFMVPFLESFMRRFGRKNRVR
ncbi:MAG: DUF1576 domain-containing protein [Lachnospiraceae bacterium]|nr:DUF1576 domain-containing protein [Lachnospiraceae bacterium]